VVLGEDPAAGEWRLQCCQFWEGALGWHWQKGDDGTSVMEEEGEVEGLTSSGAGRCMAECGKQRAATRHYIWRKTTQGVMGSMGLS
jgi:hypothetical protein